MFYNTGGERSNAWPTSRVLNMAPMQGFFFSHPLITKYIQDAPSSGLFEDPQAKGNARFFFFNSSVHPTCPHPQPNHIPGSQEAIRRSATQAQKDSGGRGRRRGHGFPASLDQEVTMTSQTQLHPKSLPQISPVFSDIVGTRTEIVSEATVKPRQMRCGSGGGL